MLTGTKGCLLWMASSSSWSKLLHTSFTISSVNYSQNWEISATRKSKRQTSTGWSRYQLSGSPWGGKWCVRLDTWLVPNSNLITRGPEYELVVSDWSISKQFIKVTAQKMWSMLLSVWARTCIYQTWWPLVCFKSCSIEKIVAVATSATERNMAIVTYQKWKTIVDQEGPDSYMDGRIVMKLWCANSKLWNFNEQWLLQSNSCMFARRQVSVLALWQYMELWGGLMDDKCILEFLNHTCGHFNKVVFCSVVSIPVCANIVTSYLRIKLLRVLSALRANNT